MGHHCLRWRVAWSWTAVGGSGSCARSTTLSFLPCLISVLPSFPPSLERLETLDLAGPWSLLSAFAGCAPGFATAASSSSPGTITTCTVIRGPVLDLVSPHSPQQARHRQRVSATPSCPSPCVGAGGWSSAWGCCSPLSPSVTPLPASSGTTYSAGRARHDGRWGAGSSAAGATPLPA